jgi:hypothetical protein
LVIKISLYYDARSEKTSNYALQIAEIITTRHNNNSNNNNNNNNDVRDKISSVAVATKLPKVQM